MASLSLPRTHKLLPKPKGWSRGLPRFSDAVTGMYFFSISSSLHPHSRYPRISDKRKQGERWCRASAKIVILRAIYLLKEGPQALSIMLVLVKRIRVLRMPVSFWITCQQLTACPIIRTTLHFDSGPLRSHSDSNATYVRIFIQWDIKCNICIEESELSDLALDAVQY